MKGIKHLVQCHCILPQYRDKKDPTFHQFVVFSVVDDSDTCIPKYVQCNNCGVVHKVIDICRSEFVVGKEDLATMTTVDDISMTMPRDVRDVLETYKADIATWEYAQFILQNQLWGTHLVLTKDTLEDDTQGKVLIFNGQNKFNIETFIRKEYLEL